MLDAEDTKDSAENGNTGHLKVISDQEQVISDSAEEVNLSSVNDDNDESVAVVDEWDFDDETHVDQETDTVDQHHHHENRIHASHHDQSQRVDINNYDSSQKDELENPSISSSTMHEVGDITNDDNMKEDEQQIKDTIDSPLLEPLEEYKNNTNEIDEVVHESQPNHTETVENEHVSDDSIQQEESSSNQVSITDHATDPDDSKCSPNDSNYGDKVPTMDIDLGENIELENDKSFEGNMESNNTNATSESCPKEVQDIDSASLHPTMEKDADDDLETNSDDIPPHGNGNISVDDVVDDEAFDEDYIQNEETIALEIISDECANNVDESGNVSFVEDPYLNSPINVDMENDKVTAVNDSIPTIDDGLSNKSGGKESSPDFDQTHCSSDLNTFTNKEKNELSISMMNSTNKMESEVEDLNALDDMNDNSETENGSKNESMEMQTPSEVLNLTDSNKDIPRHAIEKFLSQLECIHKEHELELQNMEKKHISQMEELKEKLKIAESKQPKSAVSKQAIANHDKCLKELRDLEKEFLKRLQQKEDIIEQVKEQKTLLEQRIREMVKESDNSREARKNNINQIGQSKIEIEELKFALEKAQSELKSSQEAYSTLKERVKDVATELKDRRVECRKLSTTVNDLTSQNASLESAKNVFEAKANRLSILVEGKDDQIENLTSTITNLRMELSQKEKQLIDTISTGNKALMEYKKKAQVSLSNANARAATANQAREDAEIDAANARAEAENAIKDLEKVKAEKDAIMNNKETEFQEIHKTISSKEQEVTLLLKQVSDLNKELSLAKLSVDEIQKNYDELVEESNGMSSHIEKQKEISQDLSQDLVQIKLKNDELEKEVAFLKEELEERVSKALMTNQSAALNDATSALNGTLHKDVKSQSDLGDSDGTIYLLQEELKASNEAIEELKEALANALSKSPPSSGLDDSSPVGRSMPARLNPDLSESNPLFFALEKQSELRHARDEIARLVGLLGEAEFSKSDALEELEEMRQKMNEAESRLRRYEKLGPAANSNLAGGKLNRKSFDSKMSSHSDSAANLEYLKNVILRFMKSTTLNEKKALIPVIAAVLELTPDEHRLALQSIEKSAGISGVGTSLIENVQSKGIAGFFG
jgi:chromosome segregation ATPase